MNICDYLKKERTTIEALALKIGISNSSLRNLLKGGNISTNIIQKVHKFGLSIDGVEIAGTIEALALKIGISNSSLRNLLKGGNISTNIIQKVHKFGLSIDGVEIAGNVDNLPTIFEVMERDGLTQYGFASKYGISHTNINYMLRKGYRGASHELAEHLRKQGVYVPVRTYLVPPQGNGEKFYGEPKAKVAKEPKTFLKDFQIQAIRAFGNTVIRKKVKRKTFERLI